MNDLDALRAGAGEYARSGPKLVRVAKPPPAADELVPRILYDDVAPGDTDKNAWPCKDDMTADTEADKVLLQNTFPGTFRGYGSNHSEQDATTAAKVWTTVDRAGQEQIVFGKGLAKLIRGSVSGGAAADAAYDLTSPVALDDGQLPGSTVPVKNYSTALPTGATDVTVVADGAGGWRTLDGPCPD